MPTSKVESAVESLGLERIVFFSDAVIAIAITLLVLEIKVPELEPGFSESDLTGHLLALLPQYLGFLVSFWVIAVNWISHHNLFQYIHRYDRSLIYLNFLFLAGVAFLPFPTAVLFSYPAYFASVALYAGAGAWIGLARLWLWLYAARNRRLVKSSLAPAAIQAVTRRQIILPVVFLGAIAIAAYNPLWAMYSWLLLLPLSAIFREKAHR